MKLKSFISALTVVAALLSFSSCQSNTNTYTEILSEEEIAARYSTTTTTTSETTLPKTITEDGIIYIFDEATQLYLPEKTDTEQVTEEIVKTEAETREELIAGIITAFCNKDEEAFNAYSKGSSSQKYNKIYNTWCESLTDCGFDYKSVEVTPSDFECYYSELFFDEKGELLKAIEYVVVCPKYESDFYFAIDFDDFDYSNECYKTERIVAHSYKYASTYANIKEYLSSDGVPMSISGAYRKYTLVDVSEYLK